jgi:hypothetical protein
MEDRGKNEQKRHWVHWYIQSYFFDIINRQKAFLLQEELFDLVVIDEVSVLPLLYRAKSDCIIGDHLQLPHITSVAKTWTGFLFRKIGSR